MPPSGDQNLLAMAPEALKRWISVSEIFRMYCPLSCRLSEWLVGETVTWNLSEGRGGGEGGRGERGEREGEGVRERREIERGGNERERERGESRTMTLQRSHYYHT